MSRVTLILVLIASFSVIGCVDNEKAEMNERTKKPPQISKKDVLLIIRNEIVKLGYELPDEKDVTIGVPKVTKTDSGWLVDSPLGHAWAISHMHLRIDNAGKLLDYEVEPGA